MIKSDSQNHLINNEDILITVVERDSPYVTFCFTGVGHAIGGVDIQSPEFLRCSETSTTLFIVDKKRSWGNNLDFEKIKEVTHRYTNGKILNAIGNSMGGFLAILATKYFPIHSSIAFVPQYSVSKRIIPSESRFHHYTQDIKSWKYESLSGCFNDKTLYYIFFGIDGGVEDEQRSLFPTKPNINKILFRDPGFSHCVAQRLKASGKLYDVIGSCLQNKSLNTLTDDLLKGYKVSLE